MGKDVDKKKTKPALLQRAKLVSALNYYQYGILSPMFFHTAEIVASGRVATPPFRPYFKRTLRSDKIFLRAGMF